MELSNCKILKYMTLTCMLLRCFHIAVTTKFSLFLTPVRLVSRGLFRTMQYTLHNYKTSLGKGFH